MQTTMKRSKYVALIDKYAKECELSKSLVFELKRLGTAYTKYLVTTDYHIELDNILNKMGVKFSHTPIFGEFVLTLETRII